MIYNLDLDTLLRMQAWHDGYTTRLREDEIDVRRFGGNR